ncbi:MAG: hypothetical protein ACSHXK_15315 [Oceanococcus sp.]
MPNYPKKPHTMPGKLRVGTGNASPDDDENILAEVSFDTSNHNNEYPRLWPIGLTAVGQQPMSERWFVQGPVNDLKVGEFSVSNSKSWAWVGTEAACSEQSDVVYLTQNLFHQLHQTCTQLNKPFVARLWIIIPNIHHGCADKERYKLFCTGRHLAYEKLGIRAPNFPAATVIGSHSGPIRMHALLCDESGTAVENPLQTSAYEYPRDYGPNSPSFSRALQSQHQFFVSGTAAIRGSDSQHPENVDAQLQDIDCNLEALCASQQLQQPWHQLAQYGRVYLRDTNLASTVRAQTNQLWGNAQSWPILHGDICREELLCEVETGL